MKFLFLFFALASVLTAQIPAGYQLTTVPLPKGAVTVLGLCHKPDGTLAVVSWEGEVWEYQNKTWSKFAENLMEPNGIYFDPKEEAYYVAQKPELTRLIDSNKDGICDRYECITDAFGISGEYHEYHYGPVVDSLGRKYASLNLAARGDFIVPDGKEKGKGGGNMAYTAPWRGWVYRSDRRGHFQPFASGFRSPCGIGMSPDDQLFITDNQGDWVADCCLFHVREGNFYGHPASLPARPDFTKERVLSLKAADFDKLRTPPAIWFPREAIANSPGSPVWDTTGGKFGPFQNQIFLTDQRQSNYFRCGLQKVDGDLQGWCVDFLRGTSSGGVKLSFDQQGRLWSAQVGRGWFSAGGKRTALQYAEWDGKTTPFAIHSTQLTKTGFSVTFTQPLGQEVTPKVRNYHYHYYSTYGSPMVDEKEIPVTNYQLSEDGKTVTFDVPLTAGKVYAIQFPEQQNGDSQPLDFDTIYYTANKLLPAKEAREKKAHAIQLVGSGWVRNDKTRPLPPVVTPLPEKDCAVPMPANATLLDASQWTNPNWKFDDDGVVPRSKGNNATKQSYGSARLHLEFRFDPSNDPQWTGQLYGNTGVFLQSGYELQVVNSYQNPTFADGHCGSIYGQHPPQANACRKPGEWQSYDILYKAPEFHDDGSLKEPLRVTMYHNGILIHNDAWTYGEVGKPYQKHGKRPLMIQDHKGTGVSFRNLWIVPDIDYDQSLDSFRNNFETNNNRKTTGADKRISNQTFNPNKGTLQKNDRIIFLGDSITAEGPREGGYIAISSQAIAKAHPDLNIELIGAGVGGHKVPDCQRRLDKDVLQKKPTIVFIYIGINDVWHWTHPKVVARGRKGTTPKNFENGLKDMIAQINKAGARVILCTPTVIGEKSDGSNPDDEMLDQYADISRKVARETNSQLLDLRKSFLNQLKNQNPQQATEGIFTRDKVHMNEKGNRLLSQLVLKALKVTVPPKN